MTREQARKALYRRDRSSNLYYDFTVDGKRYRGSTKTDDEEIAIGVVLGKLRAAEDAATARTLKTLLMTFSDPTKNPKYLEAQVDGTNYGYNHSTHVAKTANDLMSYLKAAAPELLEKNLPDMKPDDMVRIKMIVVDVCGRCRKAQSMFSHLKSMITYAQRRGWIESNPTEAIPNVRYDVVERDAVDILVIRKALELEPNAALPMEEIAYFLVLASTGMRRSEALALSTSQIHDGILVVEQALKKTERGFNDIGDPKWGVRRAFPLPKVTQAALSRLEPVNGRYFPYRYSWAARAVDHVIACLSVKYPEEAAELMKITCHVLRHSLNTALKVMGCPETLLEKWFGWSMRQKTMQMHYTHIDVKHLKPVANTIDYMFSPRFTGFEEADMEYDGDLVEYFDLRPVGGVFTGVSRPFQNLRA